MPGNKYQHDPRSHIRKAPNRRFVCSPRRSRRLAWRSASLSGCLCALSDHVYACLFLIADPFPTFTGRPGGYQVDVRIADAYDAYLYSGLWRKASKGPGVPVVAQALPELSR